MCLEQDCIVEEWIFLKLDLLGHKLSSINSTPLQVTEKVRIKEEQKILMFYCTLEVKNQLAEYWTDMIRVTKGKVTSRILVGYCIIAAE